MQGSPGQWGTCIHPGQCQQEGGIPFPWVLGKSQPWCDLHCKLVRVRGGCSYTPTVHPALCSREGTGIPGPYHRYHGASQHTSEHLWSEISARHKYPVTTILLSSFTPQRHWGSIQGTSHCGQGLVTDLCLHDQGSITASSVLTERNQDAP